MRDGFSLHGMLLLDVEISRSRKMLCFCVKRLICTSAFQKSYLNNSFVSKAHALQPCIGRNELGENVVSKPYILVWLWSLYTYPGSVSYSWDRLFQTRSVYLHHLFPQVFGGFWYYFIQFTACQSSLTSHNGI